VSQARGREIRLRGISLRTREVGCSGRAACFSPRRAAPRRRRGGICISRVVRDQIRDKLPYPFTDMGEQSVKNIARPVRCYATSAAAMATMPLAAEAHPPLARSHLARVRAIIAAGFLSGIAIAMVAWWAMPNGNSPTLLGKAPATARLSSPTVADGAPQPHLSIVVLPLANLSNNPDQEYFADAITEDVTTDLSRIAGSFVIAPTTAFTYNRPCHGNGVSAAAERIASPWSCSLIAATAFRRRLSST
jgi:adenylate cyclase